MKNRNLVIFFVLIILAGYGCNKLVDKAENWGNQHDESWFDSKRHSIGMP